MVPQRAARKTLSDAGSTRPIRLCRFDELSANTARGFDPDGTGADTIFVLCRGDAVRAFVNRCPHQGAALEYRKDHFLTRDGRHVMCHAHGALFDPDTGQCVWGACQGQSLAVVPCWVDRGWVWIGATA
jgi:nitrite reductase/ring-hydroxylating ferredoxin subunit